MILLELLGLASSVKVSLQWDAFGADTESPLEEGR
jgi:hypothetical protein